MSPVLHVTAHLNHQGSLRRHEPPILPRQIDAHVKIVALIEVELLHMRGHLQYTVLGHGCNLEIVLGNSAPGGGICEIIRVEQIRLESF